MFKDQRFATRLEALREIIRRRHQADHSEWMSYVQKQSDGRFRVRSVPRDMFFDDGDISPAMMSAVRNLRRGARVG